MLDSETKARIDSARDILVGKVPDPKSQVEQITIALIYKFMDDMDRQSEELGGKATFFAGEFKKYRWAQLLDKRYSGHERLLLYAESIEKMNVNKNIPQLFRDIFKGVFLPYRDPETLNLFLKEIDGFSYDHSERLGDAYEYLTSIMSSQGDAGQFRTPRHVIDFIVDVIAPGKHETILDPACGTAGFLISVFKYILKHRGEFTPDDRARLMTNFCGYDISPDYCRLSRANLYLHGFAQPRIHEYDTLTSEERWDERFDVILANPPFFTPKGGVRPHNRFSVKAKRTEVLFADYIAEHLNPGGRAGVIVPEGIIFQSQNAYKQLRKMLVEDYLWAVVSLPAGVFNPYSGVKTSILFLDRNLARQRDEVLFVKVENDGFDLGAQRRPIEKYDLPAALKILLEGRVPPRPKSGAGVTAPSSAVGQSAGEPPSTAPFSAGVEPGPPTLRVPRARLLESPDINLSGDRYRVAAARHTGKWPMVKLGEVCKVIAGQSPDGATYNDRREGMPFHQGKTEFGDTFLGEAKAWTTAPSRLAEPGDIVMSVRAPVGPVNIVNVRICIGRGLAAIRPQRSTLSERFLFHVLNGMQATIVGSHGAAFASINRSEIETITFPLPPPDEQERIVAELEGYRKVIEGARQILAAYKPTIRIDPKWPVVRLGDAADFRNGLNYSKDSKGTGLKVIGVSAFQDRLIAPIADLDEVNPDGIADGDDILADGDLVFVRSNGNKDLVGRCLLVETGGERVSHSAFTIRLRFKTRDALPLFYAILFRGASFRKQLTGRGANISNLSQDILRDMEIPLPPLAIQRQIVAELEAERKLVDANREFIARMEAKIKTKLAEVWGETGN